MAAAGIMAASSLIGGVQSAAAAREQGKFEEMQAETNARIAELQAEDAIRRGDRASAEHEKKTKALIGKQRASLAAQGIALDDGSALDIQADTAAIGAQDALTIKNNAWREAFGYRQQAQQDRFQGQIARSTAEFQANQTLLTGGLDALGHGLQGYNAKFGGKNKKVDVKEEKVKLDSGKVSRLESASNFKFA